MISKQIAFLSKETAGQPDEILGGVKADNGDSAFNRRHVRTACQAIVAAVHKVSSCNTMHSQRMLLTKWSMHRLNFLIDGSAACFDEEREG